MDSWSSNSSSSSDPFGASDPSNLSSSFNPSSPTYFGNQGNQIIGGEKSPIWDYPDPWGPIPPANRRSSGGGCGGLLVILAIVLGVWVVSSYTPKPIRPTQVDLTRPTQMAYPPTPSKETILHAEIIWSGLNVRSGPGREYNVIDSMVLVRGVVLPVLAINPDTGWLQVRLPDGRKGWITGEPKYVDVGKEQ